MILFALIIFGKGWIISDIFELSQKIEEAFASLDETIAVVQSGMKNTQEQIKEMSFTMGNISEQIEEGFNSTQDSMNGISESMSNGFNSTNENMNDMQNSMKNMSSEFGDLSFDVSNIGNNLLNPLTNLKDSIVNSIKENPKSFILILLCVIGAIILIFIIVKCIQRRRRKAEEEYKRKVREANEQIIEMMKNKGNDDKNKMDLLLSLVEEILNQVMNSKNIVKNINEEQEKSIISIKNNLDIIGNVCNSDDEKISESISICSSNKIKQGNDQEDIDSIVLSDIN